jgi:CubicO group peptidase (beta-lactamase class C family)
VLQQLLTDVTRTPFDELMRTLVIEPAGLSDSSYRQDFPDQRPGQVAMAHFTPGTPVPGGWQNMPEMAGAGLWTTPGDLVRLDLEIVRAAEGNSVLLSRELAEQMLTPQVPDGMGLGTQVETVDGRLRFGHGGTNVGYRCFTIAWPDLGAAVAAMANSDNATELVLSIQAAAQRYFGGAVPEPDGSLTSDQVTGRYQLRDGFQLEVHAGQGTRAAPVPGGRDTFGAARGRIMTRTYDLGGTRDHRRQARAIRPSRLGGTVPRIHHVLRARRAAGNV